MKYIQVTFVDNQPTSQSPAGLYIHGNMLYMVCGMNNMHPICSVLGNIKVEEGSQNQATGLNEDFILKLLAVGNRPDSVHNMINVGVLK